MNKLAKALYDNTAECADELAFKKGDIVTVMDENVAGTSGWWMCSLYGRHGLAPANRLKLLPQTETAADSSRGKSNLTKAKSKHKGQNIYHTPSIHRSANSPAYERMDMIYKVPTAPLSSPRSSVQSVLRHCMEGVEASKESTTPIQVSEKNSLTPFSELEKRYDSLESQKCSSPGNCYVYAVPPPLPQDPNYDIPAPSGTESKQKIIAPYNTLPNPLKPEWIYDVPAGSGKQSPQQGSYDTLPSSGACRQLYDTLPARAVPIEREHPLSSFYDIPKPSSVDISSPRVNPPLQQLKDEFIYAVPPNEDPLTQVISDASSDQKPLECRGDLSHISERQRLRSQGMRNFLARASLPDLPANGDSLVQKDEQGRTLFFSASESQRISTASSSSTSSCDSLALNPSSPELLREVTLSQDEVCRKLLDLQESVCRAVPQLMDFVSSSWRHKEHLEKHLKEIKQATERIACSLMCFLNFALDIKGNASRLSDANLQTRIYKQLSIIEDSSVILQQTVSSLNVAGWPLSTLCQDPGHVHAPDQLDRFVMVARTVPDDVKHLVSIIHANSKLLFRAPQRDPDVASTTDPAEAKKIHDTNEHEGELEENDNDYVELQNKVGGRKLEEVQREPKENVTPVTANKKRHSTDSCSSAEEQQPSSLPEHCRLYFGALQKAIGGFVESLHNGQPPEKFISQSKLVIMVGQRLVDTLCREAQRGGSGQSLLCKSNHLCALLKQLAVATKKAALHFPDKQALLEAQEFAKELAQRAQHFRISLDL